MKLKRWLQFAAVAPIALAGCSKFGEAMTAHTDVVARAAGHELRVEEAAQLLALNPQVPADPQVVRAFADAWVDYILLATALAEDSTLAAVDLDKFTQSAREQAVIWRLREQVIRPDTAITDAELEQQWLTQGPGAQLRARHILLRVPADATPAQRDSVRALAESLRGRAAGGADFAALATEFSQDPGSAARGGDLGFFGRGQMVAPFENAAFALEPGQISSVVESPFGYHIIRAEERRQAEIGPQREQFRQFLQQRAQQDAEVGYLDTLAARSNLQVQPGGLAAVREIAGQPNASLRGRAGSRVIASYAGGTFTAAEFAETARNLPQEELAQLTNFTDEQVEGAVKQLAQKELLLREAGKRRIELSKAETDSIRTQVRTALGELARTVGFKGGAAGRGKVNAAQVDAQVTGLLEGVLTGTRQLVPLGRLGFALRDAYSAEINEGAIPQVVAVLERVRQAQPQAQQPMPPQMPPANPQAVPVPSP